MDPDKPAGGEPRVFHTDFKTPIWVGTLIWLFLMGGSLGIMWYEGNDLGRVIAQNGWEMLLLTLSILVLMVFLPLLGWQSVKVEESQARLVYRNSWDRIQGRERVYLLGELDTVKVRRIPNIGERLQLVFKDGRTQKINLTNLKKGRVLEETLRNYGADPPEGPEPHRNTDEPT